MARSDNNTNNELDQKEIAHRRDEAIKRALRTPPMPLKDIPKKRKPKPNASPKGEAD